MTTAQKQTPKLKAEPKIDGVPEYKNEKNFNSYRLKDRSGNEVEMCFDKDNEFIRVTHRSGAGFTIGPDGSVRFISQNGKMGFEMNGEGYIHTTGKFDVIVKGDATFRVEGDTTWNAKNMTFEVEDTATFNARNVALNASAKVEVSGEDFTVTGSESVHVASAGTATFAGKDFAGISSSEGPVAVQATASDLLLQAGKKSHFTSKSGMKLIDKSGIDLNPS